MRIILFFDLPTLTSANRRAYRKFVKDVIQSGFYRIQESVFCKMSISQSNADASLKSIEKLKPSDGNIFAIVVTEHQFANMKILQGENKTDVINNFDRVIEL